MTMRRFRPILDRCGFTLFELAIYIGIACTVAGIAVPNYSTYVAKSHLNGATAMVMTDLMAARMKANKTSRKVQVFFINDHQYRICDDADGSGAVSNPEGDAILKDINLDYNGVTLNADASPLFSPRGTALNFSNIVVARGDAAKQVSVSMTGLARVVPVGHNAAVGEELEEEGEEEEEEEEEEG